MKEFNLEEAKAGKPVCTRDGRPARIICFDRKSLHNIYPIMALVSDLRNSEFAYTYTKYGRYVEGTSTSKEDLMMVSEKHKGFINLYHLGNTTFTEGSIFNTKEQAENDGKTTPEYITTIKIEWEE